MGTHNMSTVWKFSLPIEDQPAISMPRGARVLSVGFQGTSLMLWAYVPDTDAPTEQRHFFVFGTGNPISWDLNESTFVGTVQLGPMVWHVFDQMAPS